MAPLASFRAGRAYRRGESKWVDPAEGRGLVYLEEEDGLLHFYYKNLSTNSTSEDEGGLDLLVFPSDATFSLVPSTRIAVLKFHSSSHRHFFWPQDVDASSDQATVERINGLIGGAEEEGADAIETDALMGGAGEREGSAPSGGATASAALGSAEQMAQLNAIVAGLGATPRGAESQTPEFLLPDLLPPSRLHSLLTTSPHLVPILLPFLPPEVPQTAESLRTALTGSEFRRQLSSLDRALRTGALGPLVVGLGLPAEAATGIDSFLEAIEKQAEGQL